MQTSNIAALLSCAALLASGSADAAIANGSVDYSNLQFRVIDLTPNDGVAAGYTVTGTSSSLYFAVLDRDWHTTNWQRTASPTHTTPPTSWTQAGRDYQGWTGATGGSAAIAVGDGAPDGSAIAVLQSGWRFNLAPGTALVVTATMSSTLTRTGGPAYNELGIDNTFWASAYVDSPGADIYTSQWTEQWHTYWSQGGTYTDSFGLTLINSGTAEATGALDLIANTYAYTYLDAPPPIPEPAGWMMLGAGMLAVGAAARRRKS
jgi:hypothetical protein